MTIVTRTWRRRQGLQFAVAAAVGLGLAAGLTGCNIAAGAYLLVNGPPKVKKRMALEKERPTVIFIDDRNSRIPRRTLRQDIAQTAETLLLEKGTLKDVISFRAALLVASQEEPEKPFSITDVGKAVGAEVVVYATVDQFTLSPDGQTFTPTAVLRVKVLDVTTNERIWPDEDAGEIVMIRMDTKQGTAPRTGAERARAEADLAKTTGLGLSQVFYEHVRMHSVIVP